MWCIGVDVGGTFTDVAVLDDVTGRRLVRKLPTTPSDRSVAVLDGIQSALGELGCDARDISRVAHGTTVGTNALIEHTGARTALITTEGFRDVLEFRRMNKIGILDPYDFQIKLPVPLVPREHRHGIGERLDPTGSEVRPVDVASLAAVCKEMKDEGIEAVAVSFLFSFRNPAHERQAAAEIERQMPGIYVTLSSDIDPQMLEYERTSTAVVNAYLGPPVGSYLDRIRQRATAIGLPPVQIMQSNGGLASVESAMAEPARLLESGPAAGLVAAAKMGKSLGTSNIIVVDMGGTSFDVGIIKDGEPERATAVEFEGYAVRLPMLDIRSIGAGGGSIAYLDTGRTLRVGPRSAGAQPGPACYGRGGGEPTTTDADLVLGYFADDALGNGAVPLDRRRAEDAIQRHLAAPLGLSLEEAAAGVVRVVDANMADAIRAMVTYRGLDPRDFTLVAGGGAGPLHASRLAVELGISDVIIPPHPGALSAVGLTQADVLHEAAVTVDMLLVEPDECARRLHESFKMLDDRVFQFFDIDRIGLDDVVMAHSIDLQYYGQSFQLVVPIDYPVGPESVRACLAAFHAMHKNLYGVADEKEVVLCLTCRSIGTYLTIAPALEPYDQHPPEAERRKQRAWFPESGSWQDATVIDRALLRAGTSVDGPALIDQTDSATVLLPGHRATVLQDGSLRLEIGS
jgi:N-methylhydantoinase A